MCRGLTNELQCGKTIKAGVEGKQPESRWRRAGYTLSISDEDDDDRLTQTISLARSVVVRFPPDRQEPSVRKSNN